MGILNALGPVGYVSDVSSLTDDGPDLGLALNLFHVSFWQGQKSLRAKGAATFFHQAQASANFALTNLGAGGIP
jgi:hypothetical protein